MLRACQWHAQAEEAGMLARVRTPSLPVREREREAEFLCLQGCARPLHQSEREREREKEEGEREM